MNIREFQTGDEAGLHAVFLSAIHALASKDYMPEQIEAWAPATLISALLGLVEHCHCSMCRKAHGTAFSTNSLVPTTALKVTAGADLVSEYESSPNRRECFCSKCGSQLFIRRVDKPEYTVVTLGTLEGDPQAWPERHVFVESKAAWYNIGDALPQFKIYPGFEPDEK